ncbi:methionyl-tRNA formyltransferase [Stappia stellulata]|uniref:methionyl-tRNA formyltransferase n=1 Tax=Stappia stellulata TaxID=71235 RepID=UPI001CD64CB0|nr:methionyl-tRNA formyltransferase [Stappia stellulata]MCA1240899.1 methionyl-tRNA formyltransferase [Stappia stellulata]
MARITSFEKKHRDQLTTHGGIPATYFVQKSEGRILIQIDTHGSEHRKLEGKVSQSIQLDDVSARELLGILKFELDE